jgi:enamine deaminase RidA (YjgF/YER057c/UK114 family)
VTLEFLHPKSWVPAKGYSNGIAATGKMIFVAGQIGWNPRSTVPEFPNTFAGQFEQTLKNIVEVLAEAKAPPSSICRMTIYVTDKKEYLASLKECGAAWKSVLGKHYPAMALVQVAGLVEDLAKVEIEVTAVISEENP